MRSQKRGRIVLITGVMAAGKSTVAEEIARQLPRSVHLRGDVFRKMIVNGRVEMSGENDPAAMDQLRMRYELAAIAAKHFAQKGYDVVYQDTIIGSILNEVVALYEGFEMMPFVLLPRSDVILKRERERHKTGYKFFTVEHLYSTFNELTPRLGNWIDNSDQLPQETARMVLDILDAQSI